MEGTSPQVDNRGVVVVRGKFGGSSSFAKRSERPGFESPCGAFAREASDASSRSERARGRRGRSLAKRAGRSRSERCVRGLEKKIVTSPRSLDPILDFCTEVRADIRIFVRRARSTVWAPADPKFRHLRFQWTPGGAPTSGDRRSTRGFPPFSGVVAGVPHARRKPPSWAHVASWRGPAGPATSADPYRDRPAHLDPHRAPTVSLTTTSPVSTRFVAVIDLAGGKAGRAREAPEARDTSGPAERPAGQKTRPLAPRPRNRPPAHPANPLDTTCCRTRHIQTLGRRHDGRGRGRGRGRS